jgi:hypothetical protein
MVDGLRFQNAQVEIVVLTALESLSPAADGADIVGAVDSEMVEIVLGAKQFE